MHLIVLYYKVARAAKDIVAILGIRGRQVELARKIHILDVYTGPQLRFSVNTIEEQAGHRGPLAAQAPNSQFKRVRTGRGNVDTKTG